MREIAILYVGNDFISLKNQFIQQGRYEDEDCVDEIIFKVSNAPIKKVKIEYV